MTTTMAPAAQRELALYLHVPYCRSRCSYCDFNAHVLPQGKDIYEDYSSALTLDIQAQESSNLSSIFWGGGTPSLMPIEPFTQLIAALREKFHWEQGSLEHSIETNPGTVDPRKLEAYLELGVNRISFGAQSFQDSLLELVGRVHDADEIGIAFQLARRAGFENLSLDLIYGLPQQSLEDWEESLARALELDPQHLSIYQLTVEPSTRLESQLDQGELKLPCEDLTIAMDELANRELQAAGYQRYEISNWAKPGFECQHNIHYWNDLDYLGLGCGAVSFLDSWRIERIKAPAYYQRAFQVGRSPVTFAERRGSDGALKDKLMMGLRLRDGVTIEALASRFPELDLQSLRAFFEGLPSDWWERSEHSYRLTPRGWDFHSEVTMELMDVMFSFS